MNDRLPFIVFTLTAYHNAKNEASAARLSALASELCGRRPYVGYSGEPHSARELVFAFDTVDEARHAHQALLKAGFATDFEEVCVP